MLKIIKRELNRIIKDIDAGNSNLTEEEEIKLLDIINSISRKDEGISKYTACIYLNISRATFDNYVREEKIPKGKHIQGFKELRWFKKDLDKFIEKNKLANNTN
jgi:predicted DNA-binding transcriptional regulator AlpA